MSEAIMGSGIRAFLEQPTGLCSLGTATWTGAGYTVEWDDGFKDAKGVVWHFGRDSYSLQLVEADVEDEDNDYPERCELCEEEEEEPADAEEILNAVLDLLGEALGLGSEGDDFVASPGEILDLALIYIAVGKRVL